MTFVAVSLFPCSQSVFLFHHFKHCITWYGLKFNKCWAVSIRITQEGFQNANVVVHTPKNGEMQNEQTIGSCFEYLIGIPVFYN